MIKSFKCKYTALLFERESVRKFKAFERQALKRLVYLDSASCIEDLLTPPSNRVEKLKGERAHQYSMRINNRWRLCFEWKKGHAWNVEIVDYH